MKRFVVTGLVFITIVAAALVYFTYPRPAPRAASWLPDTTLLYLDVPNFSRARTELRDSPASALWKAPEVQAFREEPRRRLAEALGFANAHPIADGPNEALLALARGEVFLAVTHISAAPTLQPGLVVGVE